MTQQRSELVSIQMLRAIAALSVAFYHVFVIGRMPSNYGFEYWGEFAKPGLLGVNLFFVLSGFIILRAHIADIGNPSRLPRYINRRFTRIYPLYWVLSAAYVAAAFIGLGDPDFTMDARNILSSIFLIEFSSEVHPPLQVAWTLFYEMKFYILFALLIVNMRLGVVVIAAELMYIVLAQLNGWQDMFHLSSLWFIHFFFGMGAYFLSTRLKARMALPVLLTGLLAVGYYIAVYNYDMTNLKHNEWVLWILAPGFAAILLGFVLLEDVIRRVCPAWLRLLGDASYSIYLVHSAAISVMFIITRKLGLLKELPTSLTFIGFFVAATIAGVMVYFVLERPLLAMARGERPKISFRL